MQSAIQKSGPSPYALSLMTGILLVAVTAYPKPLDESASGAEKKAPTAQQCMPAETTDFIKAQQ